MTLDFKTSIADNVDISDNCLQLFVFVCGWRLLLLIHCVLMLPLCESVFVWSSFCDVVLILFVTSLTILLMRKRESCFVGSSQVCDCGMLRSY